MNMSMTMMTPTSTSINLPLNNYGDWNFKPAARLIWDFFRHFSRDMETKKLNYTE